jgi:energy-coupling factor transporter ATP-binding protein EcfA2
VDSAYFAHVDLEGGVEAAMAKFNQFKEEVYCSKSLLGIEIGRKENADWYTFGETNADRRRLIQMRSEKLGLGEGYSLPKVMASDAHTLSALGKNAAGDRKLTRFKMETLSFAALQLAFQDAAARVRIEEAVPTDVPRFVGIRVSGGFLDKQVVRFNKNLNCIIGGRGTGKSTLLESTRVGAGNQIGRDDFVDSDAWPDRIELVFQDETGRQQVFVREKFSDVVNQTDPRQGITRIPIESYGQGDTAEAIQHSDKDPGVLLQFLDEFLTMEELRADDDQIRQQLLDNQSHVERVSLEVKTIPEVEKAKKNADEQVKALKQKDASKLVVLEEKLANGKAFRQQLVEDLSKVVKSARTSLSDTSMLDSIVSRDGSDLPVGRAQFDEVCERVKAFAEKLGTHSTDIQAECDLIVSEINQKLGEWRTAEAKVQQEIDGIRKELEGKGVRLDVGFIKKTTKDAAEYAAKLSDLRRKKVKLEGLITERSEVLLKREATKKKAYNERAKLAVTLEQNLKSTVVDYSIAVQFREGRYSPELEDIIKDAMEYRTSRVPRGQLIAKSFSPLELARVVQKKQATALTAITSEGETVFSKSEADQIIERLSQPTVQFALERCTYEDLPEIRVSKLISLPSGAKKHITKTFAKLSLGQQQSILLSIMLFSKNRCPLIIDQPEDNLDSEFIYKTFVRVLRTIKERRQVIIVTHNANIAVLGDAELILPLKTNRDHTIVQDRGSIDTPATRILTCSILEGSEEAFRKRMRIYGIK